jgi:predicted transcriptional regulator of viral defense system
MLTGMRAVLRAVADAQGGVVTRNQARQAGYAPDEIDLLVRRGEWMSVRRGAYAERDRVEAMSDEQRHLALLHAIARSLREPAVVSHVSAALLHGLPTWGIDLSEIHISRQNLHASRHEAGAHHHRGNLTDSEVIVVDGVKVTSLARTVLDTARTASFEAAVVVADAAFARDPKAQSVALDLLNTMRDWPGARQAGSVVEFADGRSESVGESRCRVCFREGGLPRPVLQHEIFAPNGRLIGRSDFGFLEFLTLGEFDGKGKYLRGLRNGESPGDVVWREKKREDRLREQGFEVGRVVWAELGRPEMVGARFRKLFARCRTAKHPYQA